MRFSFSALNVFATGSYLGPVDFKARVETATDRYLGNLQMRTPDEATAQLFIRTINQDADEKAAKEARGQILEGRIHLCHLL